ncbi:MAG: PA domain-containing protein [Lysobacter sp.]
MNKSLLASAIALAATLSFASAAQASHLTLINGDNGTQVGLNDPTAAAPVGGNPGTTIGEQRRIAYQYAMDAWGAVLQSNVEIKVYASFARLTCTATSATLGQAGPNWIVNDFPGSRANTLYHSALGDAIAGEDLVPDPDDPADISSAFNGDLGKPDCLAGRGWYLGLDGKTPDNAINFLNVVMHEIGHGLGASGFLNKTTGVLGLGTGLTDVYTANAYDNVQNKRFDDPAMTNALRATAMKSPGRTVWDGAQVNTQAALILDKRTVLQVTAPAAAAGSYEVGFAEFGPAATATSFPSNQLVLINDGVAAASTSDGCETPFVNAAAVAGKIALIDRGTCNFAVKAKNAQLNGAAGVVIVNNTGGVQGMGNSAPPITDLTIPTVMISQSDGALVRANLPATANVAVDAVFLQGADRNGRTRLYSPTVVAGGSTFSHFDTDLQPNALMEPFDTPEIQSQLNVDLTPALFTDIGWTLNPGNALLGTCNTTVKAVETGGLIAGANITAESNLCAASAHGSRALYLRCISDHATEMQQKGAITATQLGKVRQCAATVRP